MFHVRIEEGGVEARQGSATDPDLVVVGATEAFLAVAAGRVKPEDAVKAGSIWVGASREEGGHDEALFRCLGMLKPAT